MPSIAVNFFHNLNRWARVVTGDAAFQRAVDGGITAERSPANGLARAERKARGLVVADGDRTRYQGGAYEVREASGRNAPTWVVPQDASLVPNGTGLLFFL